MVHANQQAYYDAISESSRRGDSGPFIDFMLQEILNTLKSHQGEALDVGTNVGINVGDNLTGYPKNFPKFVCYSSILQLIFLL